MKLFAIAFRNVFRNRRRTGFTLMVIVFGAMAMILAGGFFASSFEGLRELTIRNELGHLQVYTAQYLESGEDKPLEHGISDHRQLQVWLESQPHVAVTTAQVDFVGLISNGDKSEAFLGRGVDPDREERMGFSLNIKKGHSFSNDAAENEVLLASGLASNLRSKIGDVLTVLGTTTDGALNAIDARVIGFFSTGIKEYDQRAIKVALKTAQTLLNTDRVTKVIIRLDKTANTEGVRQALSDSLPSVAGNRLKPKTWLDLATFYHQVVLLYRSIFVFLGTIIVILVVLSSSNTMTMSVLERTQEIGTMMSLGVLRWQILSIFVAEGLLIGILGGAFGIVGSVILMQVINHARIVMPPPPTFNTGVPLQINFVPQLCLGVFILMSVCEATSALFPALRGARLKIVDALRHI